MSSGLVLVLTLFSFIGIPSAEASLVINEIAYKGSGESNCGGEDWIELLNTDDEEVVDLTNYILHDDKGEDDEDVKTFAADTIVAPGELLVLCKDEDFEFGIGNDDTITLIDATGITIDSVTLQGTGADDGTETYAYIDGKHKYTTTPTPGEANVYTEPISMEEKLRVQNDAGNDFFLVNDAQTFSKVVDIYISVDEESTAIIEDHPAWEQWVPFIDLSVSNTGGNATGENSSIISSGGRIRTKGQSTNSVVVCSGQKNVPFNIAFDTPFLGMESMYLRNHFLDYSFMRDHASHVMLEAFGLPYLRTRPARIFLNGDYVGFYTVMEAPTQGYVMQRSFGAFDPEKTALFKAKSMMGECPYDTAMLPDAGTVDPPDPYYFERGDHREDTPVLTLENVTECNAFFFSQLAKEQADVIAGYLEYDKKCGLAMVEMGRVDRDYGPKSMEDPMIAFLDNKFYNESVDDLTDSIDTDQWLRNFAVYAVMVNVDSPLGNINNWYLATTQGGVDDWKIVQYDHNNVASGELATLICDMPCGPRMAYWSILQPTCGSVEDHKIAGRVLNSEENVQKYLNYVQEYVTLLTTGDILEKLYAYGNDIKEYVIDDSYNNYPTMEAYEDSELGANIEDYNTVRKPFLKFIQVRLQEVQKQLDAIQEGTLPLDGVYSQGAICPDWRDSSSEDYFGGSTMGDDCAIPFCEEAAVAACYGIYTCSAEGDITLEACKAISPVCDSCFPYSRCGTGGDPSGTFLESETCGSELAECAAASMCFDHGSGICAYDGEILTVECQASLPSCKPCFPHSRCGSGEAPEILPNDAPADSPEVGGDASSSFVASTAAISKDYNMVTVVLVLVVALQLSGFGT